MHTYGSDAFRPLSRSFRAMFAADGRTLLLHNGYAPAPGTLLQAMDTDTGAIVAGDAVLDFVPVGDLVVAAPADDPSTLGVYRIRDLARVRTVPVGVPAVEDDRLAVGGGTVAMPGRRSAKLVVLDTGTWQARHVDVSGTPLCAAVSDDGAIVVVGTAQGRTGRVLVVDAVAGTVRYALSGPRAAVGSVAVRGDLVVAAAGNRLLAWPLPPATGSATGTRRSTAVPKAIVLHTFEKHRATVLGVTPGGLVLAHDGHLVAAVAPATGQVVWSEKMSWASRVALAGDRLIWAGYTEVEDRDPESGTVRRTWPVRGPVLVHAVTPRLVAFGWDARVGLLRAHGGAPRPPAGHESPVRDVSFDGDRFATVAGDRWAYVWSRGRADPVAVIDGARHDRPGEAVHLAGDDLYTGFGGCVQRWSLDDPATTAAQSAPLRYDVTLIRPLAGGDLVLAAVRAAQRGSGALCLLDATTLSVVERSALEWTVHAADPLDEHRLLLRGDLGAVEYDTVAHRLGRWRTYTGRPYARTHHLYPRRSTLVEMCSYPNRRDPSCRHWLAVTDLSDGTVRHDRIETPEFTGCGDLSAEGVFAAPHLDAIRLWDLDAGKMVHELPTPPLVHRVWWFPDGRSLLAGSDNGALHEVPAPGR
ncbi:hypothetical protein [Polymorphospora sp. NPDC050346]|uniref:WD40 repeat domain-containing protein n=1 Tax=Polymorphospora sp. NPDC050346 TaxID=3155780 RepID=UPI0033E1BC33